MTLSEVVAAHVRYPRGADRSGLRGKAGNLNADVGPYLHDGENTITIIAQNGPTAFGGGCAQSGCDYAHNPAFVIFDGQIACE